MPVPVQVSRVRGAVLRGAAGEVGLGLHGLVQHGGAADPPTGAHYDQVGGGGHTDWVFLGVKTISTRGYTVKSAYKELIGTIIRCSV